MKPRANKLDSHREAIREWAAEGKSLKDIVAQLREDGITSSISSVGEYLQRMREEDDSNRMLTLIANGGQMQKELESAYAANPAPALEQLMKLTSTLIMTLQVRGAENPGMLRMANAMQKTMLAFLSGKTKAEIELRKLAIDERKVKLLEAKCVQAKEELQKLRDPKAQLGDEDRKAIVDKVDEILGIK